MKRLFILLGMVFSVTTVFSQSIVKGEYFIDVDPGPGNGTALPNFPAADTVNLAFTIPTATLSSGFHYLATRVMDADGKWSRYESRGFYLSSTTGINAVDIVAAEFFYDTDPGVGQGWPASVGTAGPVVTFTAIAPVPLNTGFHFLSMRVKDANGIWSLYEQRGFYVIPFSGNSGPIVAAEYFYDADPGIGNGSPLSVITPGDTVTQTFNIPVPNSLSQGQHFLGLRVKDQSGTWSLFASDTVTIGPSVATISCPGNKTVNSLADQCMAIVDSIDAVVSPSGTAYTYTLSGATTGIGTGTASGHSFNSGVTTVTYALANSPTTTCSFTVTVNANVVPSVTIDANNTMICTGGTIVFTAHPTNGGATPHYQWKQNGVNVGTDSVIYQTNTLNNGDVVSVVMTSSIGCANPASGTSNSITVTVNQPYITPTINITASATTICPGTPVTFVATSTNGGVPWYSWYVNANYVGGGPNVDTFQTSTLVTGDKVKCILTSSLACVTSVSTVSNEITMTAGTVVPAVSIVATNTTICPGQSVIFTATPTNGGSSPYYEWTVNGIEVGTNSNIYQSSTLSNGDTVKVYMTSSSSCVNPTWAVSNKITMIVSTVTPSVTINASSTSICNGQSVTFTATPTNGGTNPVYEWIVNTGAVNMANSNIFQTSTLHNGDQVKVSMVTSLGCASPTEVFSNTINMTVTDAVTPSVSMSTTAENICAGTSVTFYAAPISGAGDHPSYQWKVNGNNVGTDSSVWQSSSLVNGDVVRVAMTSSLGCANPTTVLSHDSITMTVTSIAAAPSVTITADHNPVCNGTTVTFSTQPTNGGLVPGYQWKLNGNNVGFNQDTYTTDSLHNADAVQVEMNSSLGCVTASTVTSNTIQMIVQNCDSTLPVLMTRNYPVKEGNAGLTILNAQVTLDKPATQTVTVHYATSNDDAIAGLDYVATSGTLTIPAGDSSGIVQLRIIGDLLKESNERFNLNFTNPVNVALPADPRSKIMIIDDDKGKGGNGHVTTTDRIPSEVTSLIIPNVAKRDQIWMIPQIGNYKNEIAIVNAQGQTVKRFVNYQNNISLGDLAVGLYFYKVIIVNGKNQVQYYSGRLLITE